MSQYDLCSTMTMSFFVHDNVMSYFAAFPLYRGHHRRAPYYCMRIYLFIRGHHRRAVILLYVDLHLRSRPSPTGPSYYCMRVYVSSRTHGFPSPTDSRLFRFYRGRHGRVSHTMSMAPIDFLGRPYSRLSCRCEIKFIPIWS